MGAESPQECFGVLSVLIKERETLGGWDNEKTIAQF